MPYSSGKTSALDIDFPVTLRDALLSITSDQVSRSMPYLVTMLLKLVTMY